MMHTVGTLLARLSIIDPEFIKAVPWKPEWLTRTALLVLLCGLLFGVQVFYAAQNWPADWPLGTHYLILSGCHIMAGVLLQLCLFPLAGWARTVPAVLPLSIAVSGAQILAALVIAAITLLDQFLNAGSLAEQLIYMFASTYAYVLVWFGAYIALQRHLAGALIVLGLYLLLRTFLAPMAAGWLLSVVGYAG